MKYFKSWKTNFGFYFVLVAWYYIEEAQYWVGEEEPYLTVRFRRDGFNDVQGSVGKSNEKTIKTFF